MVKNRPNMSGKEKPYFNAKSLAPSPYYVARIDMMGARAAMTRSISVSGNFIGKLHVALLEAAGGSADALIPTIDGAYIVCKERKDVESILGATLRSLARLFVDESNRYRQFIARGGIAYGPIVLGSSLGDPESRILAQPGSNAEYRDNILIGIPVVQAYDVETTAPPFGVRVHPSAKAFAPEGNSPFPSNYWRWYDKHQDKELVEQLRECLDRYFEFMAAHEHELEYPAHERERHDVLRREYFWTPEDPPADIKSDAAVS